MHAVAWGGAIFNRGRHRVVDFSEIDVFISNLFGKIFDFDTLSVARATFVANRFTILICLRQPYSH